MRGVDYKSQVELVDELYEDTFDLDGDSKVRIYLCVVYIHVLYNRYFLRPHSLALYTNCMYPQILEELHVYLQPLS